MKEFVAKYPRLGSLFHHNMLMALIAIQYFGFFFDDNLFYLCTALIYAKYVLNSDSITRTATNRILLWFFIAIITAFVIVNLRRMVTFEFLDFSNRDWKIVITPIVCVMIVDSVYSLARFYQVKLHHFSIAILLAIVAGTFAYVAISPEVDHARLFDFSNRRSSGLVTRNVNMADDVYFFLICSILAFSIFCRIQLKYRVILFGVLAILAVYFLAMIMQGQSRGGWLGILAGSGFVMLYAAALKRYVPILIVTVLLVPLLLVRGETLLNRLSFESELRQQVWSQIRETGTIDLDSLQEKDGVSTYSRILSYKNGWDLFTLHPYVGHGWFVPEKMTHMVTYPDLMVKIRHLHNFFLDIAVRQGVFIMLVYLGLILIPVAFLIRTSFLHRRDSRFFYFCSIYLAFSIYLFVENLTNLTFIRSDPGVRIQYILMGIYGLILYESGKRLADHDENATTRRPGS